MYRLKKIYMKKLIYLCTPYSNKDSFIQEYRYISAYDTTAHLLKQGHVVFSPIACLLDLAKKYKMDTSYDFWKNYCETFIASCDEVWVLNLDGWNESKGVMGEIEFAKNLNKPVQLYDHISLEKVDDL